MSSIGMCGRWRPYMAGNGQDPRRWYDWIGGHLQMNKDQVRKARCTVLDGKTEAEALCSR